MNVVKITSLNDPRIAVFHALTEAQLRNKLHKEQGLFIAESPKVIKVALKQGFEPVALLCEEKHIARDAADIINQCNDIVVYTGTREMLANLTGYVLTRGVLCAMKRPILPTVESVCSSAKRLAVIDGVVDTTNIGAIFRSAAALGIDGVLLTPSSCDPFNRRAVRVSMGSVFLLPWTWLNNSVSSLKQYGFKTAAMALTNRSVSLNDERLKAEQRLAIVMGTEGDGLEQTVIDEADYVVKIPMHHEVDSLNVAAASAVAFWELGKPLGLLP